MQVTTAKNRQRLLLLHGVGAVADSAPDCTLRVRTVPRCFIRIGCVMPQLCCAAQVVSSNGTQLFQALACGAVKSGERYINAWVTTRRSVSEQRSSGKSGLDVEVARPVIMKCEVCLPPLARTPRSRCRHVVFIWPCWRVFPEWRLRRSHACKQRCGVCVQSTRAGAVASAHGSRVDRVALGASLCGPVRVQLYPFP